MEKFIKRMLSICLSAFIVMGQASAVMAEEGQNGTAQQEADGETQNAQPMTREEERQAGYAMPVDTNSLAGWPEGPGVYGSAAIVMDMNSGAVPFGKNIDEKRYPASITKLLTALVALENSELTDEVEITNDSIACLSPGDSHIGMTPGEIISMDDALHALLLASANEVAHAIAESVGAKMGGNYDTFIQKMNERAEELGCTGSHWTNANGLHEEDHYTTAHDMALIASAVYQYDEFRRISQTLSYTIPPTNLVNESRTFQQKHKMLWSGNKNYYEYTTGGKTGYTDNARTTLVTMADNGELQLAAVVLYDFGQDAYVDTKAMFEYVFNNFSKIKLGGQDKPENVQSFTDPDAYVLLPDGVEFTDLDQEITDEDAAAGTAVISYTYEGQAVGSADVTLTSDYIQSLNGASGQSAENTGRTEQGESAGDQADDAGLSIERMVMAGGAVLVGLMLVVLFIVTVLKVRQIRRRRMRRLNRQRIQRAAASGRRRTRRRR